MVEDSHQVDEEVDEAFRPEVVVEAEDEVSEMKVLQPRSWKRAL